MGARLHFPNVTSLQNMICSQKGWQHCKLRTSDICRNAIESWHLSRCNRELPGSLATEWNGPYLMMNCIRFTDQNTVRNADMLSTRDNRPVGWTAIPPTLIINADNVVKSTQISIYSPFSPHLTRLQWHEMWLKCKITECLEFPNEKECRNCKLLPVTVELQWHSMLAALHWTYRWLTLTSCDEMDPGSVLQQLMHPLTMGPELCETMIMDIYPPLAKRPYVQSV